MIEPGRVAKILLIDSNVYFSKRLSDALKREGFEVLSSTQPAFALTTLEYDTPTAVVCATNMREMGALEIAKIIHADPRNASLPIIALGDGSQRALMEAFQAGCDDYIDRQRQPAVIATHIRNIIVSKAEGFQPTQMLAQADTSLSGSLSHHDLPGVLQMLGQAPPPAPPKTNPPPPIPPFSSTLAPSRTRNAAASLATKPSSTSSRAASMAALASTNLSMGPLRRNTPCCVPLLT